MTRFQVTLSLLVAAFASPIVAVQKTDAEPDLYRHLQTLQFGEPVAIDAPVALEIEDARFVFDSGTFRVSSPAPDQLPTGFIFEGSGQFSVGIPDRLEAEQLARLAGTDPFDRFESSFSRLYIRTSLPVADQLGLTARGTGGHTSDLVVERQGRLLRFLRHDVDARVIRALENEGDDYLLAEMETGHGWLLFNWDTSRHEEMTLIRWDQDHPEGWLSLDRRSDRAADGRPSGERNPEATLRHIDIHAELVEGGRGNRLGSTRMRPTIGSFRATLDLLAERDHRAIELSLDRAGDVRSVTDGEGEELEWVRFPIGEEFRTVDSKYNDDSLLVMLDGEITAGDAYQIVVDYQLEVPNYGLGDSWYPTPPDAIFTRYTARMELITPDEIDIRAVGSLEAEREEGGRRHSVWRVDTPVKMLTFTIGERYHEETIERAGLPTVTAFAPRVGLGSSTKVYNVAADVSNSINFFERLFASELDVDRVLVTGIPSGHGQSFAGFIHMSEGTFSGESPGASELFRAHEVAHQWFGHKVGWESYRDQWLSESLAEYAAMMFIESEATVKNGRKFFEEILMVYHNTLFGSLKGGMSKFSRPWLAAMVMNETHMSRLGPIGVGYRAGTRDIPAGYQIQNYIKGPVVLHMLRILMRMQTGNDELFIRTLRDFVNTYDGRLASTEDFKQTIVKNTNANWDWFFDQWIDGTEIPTFYWDYDVPRRPNADGKYPITIRLRREGVSDDFMQPIPISVDFGKDRHATITIISREASEEFTYELPARPRAVVFNPDHSILARVGRM